MPLKQVKNEKFITIPKEEFESMEATIETLRDREVLKGIEKSRKEIKQGKCISLDELEQELSKD